MTHVVVYYAADDRIDKQEAVVLAGRITEVIGESVHVEGIMVRAGGGS
ncbi:hypothetical protein ABQF35_14510 [Mycobacterium syngnathidarum]